MKKLSFFAILVSMALVFTACPGPDDPEVRVESITIYPAILSLVIEETGQLTATLAPEGVIAEITWSSSNTAVATVNNNGLVTAVSVGSATITATADGRTAEVPVGVTEPIEPCPAEALLRDGLEFFPIVMDGTSFAMIEDRVTADLRINNITSHLFLWGGSSYVGGTTDRLTNFFGRVPEYPWVVLEVAPGGTWSGAGVFLGDPYCQDLTNEALLKYNLLTRVTTNPEGWYFHMAVRSRGPQSHLIAIGDGAGAPVGRFVVGSSPTFVYTPAAGPSTTFHRHPNGNVPADGEWHSVLVPLSFLMSYAHPGGPTNNLVFTERPQNAAGRNIAFFLSGNQIGAVLEMDALFFIRK